MNERVICYNSIDGTRLSGTLTKNDRKFYLNLLSFYID